MMLVEQTTIPSGTLPLAAFKDHLRLGTGFTDDDVQDAVLEAYLRAAIAAIETRIGKATIVRSYQWTVTAWRDLASQVLPVAPVTALTSMSVFDRNNVEEVIDPARYALVPDMHRPRLLSTGFCLPPLPVGGRAVIVFEAGLATGWGDLPADLSQAVMLLAAEYYEERSTPGETRLPSAVSVLLTRYRDVRLFGGGRA